MCEPLISRTRLAEFTPSPSLRKLDTQGPAALTRARARDLRRGGRAVAHDLGQPAAAVAPGALAAGAGADHGTTLGGASMALSTTSRLSSTQQSA